MQSITLQTSDSIITSGDFLGRLGFAASSELDGADALLVAATIEAIAEGNFTQTSNSTSLVFSTADSETALPKLKITSGGHFIPLASGTYDLGSLSLPFRNLYVDGGYVTAPTGVFDTISFNVDNESILSKGEVSWSDTDGSLTLGLTDNTTVSVGESRYLRIRNETGGTLYKGQVIYATGIHSNGLITPDLYVADGAVREIRFIGVVLEDVNDSNNGYALDFGQIIDIDLDGSASNYAIGDETWVAGDILYVHPTVAGKLTKVEPKHSIIVAIVLDPGNGNGNGRMFVRPTSYGHLDDNHDVAVSGATNGQFLQYNSVTDYWVPSSSGNFTTLEVNGTEVPTGVGASNYSTKWTGANSLGTGVIYDDGTNVGIGTASPSSELDVSGIITATSGNSTNWNAAYSWGDHSTSGYLIDITSENIEDLNNVIRDFSYPILNEYTLIYDSGISAFKGSSINLGLIKQGTIPLVGYSSAYLGYYIRMNNGEFTVNEQGTNLDFRVEGDTDANLLFTDASLDTVSMGGVSLGNKLYISSSNTTSYAYILASGGLATQSSLSTINNSSNITSDSFAGLFLTTTRSGSSVSQGAIIANVATNASTYQPNIVFAARNGGSTYAELMRIDYAGNVGIGTSSPSAKLQVENGNVIFNDLGGTYDFRVEGDADQYLLYVKGSAGSDRVGIGTASPAGKLHVYQSTTNQSYQYTSYVSANHYTTTNATNYIFGNYTDIRKHVSTGITDTGYVMGHDIIAVLSNEGTLTGSYGLRTYAGINNQSSNGNVTAAYGIQSRVLNYSQGTGNINTARGIDVYINGDLGSVGNGGITNAYAVYINSILNATNKYGIYQVGSSDINYFAGNLGVGTSSPATKLNILSNKGVYGNLYIQDSTTMAAGVGGSIVFAGKYTSAGDYARYGLISAIKENSTSADSKSSMVFYTNDQTGAFLEEKVRITSNGHVGIGTNPADFLDSFSTYGPSFVLGDGLGDTAQFINSASSSNGYIWFTDGPDLVNLRGHIGFLHSEDKLVFGAGGVGMSMGLDPNGNLGIGQIYPTARLNVEGGNVIFNDNGGNFDFRVEGDTDQNLLFVDASTDDVGIGTPTPAAKLHVAGDSLFENLSYRRFTTSTAVATHFRKYYDIAHYANSISTVAGSLRIEIPVTTSTMWSMDVVIVEYDGVDGSNIKTTNLTITGYSTSNLNKGVWTNNPGRISQVRFGRKSGGGATIVLIDPVSTFRYPKAYIKEINTHHSNETTFANSANYNITITTNETDFVLSGTITNNEFIRDDKLVNTFGNQTVDGNKTFNGEIKVNNNIVPATDNTGSVGTEALTWNSGRFTNFTVDSTLIVLSGASVPFQVGDLENSQAFFAVRGGPFISASFGRSGAQANCRIHYYSGPVSIGNSWMQDASETSFSLTRVVGNVSEPPAFKLQNGQATFNNAFTLPSTDGSSGQTLVTNGSGVVSWSSAGSNNLTRGSFDLTQSSGTFNVDGGYNVGTLDVYYNGIKLLSGTDYTATNGTSFTLTNVATSGDVVEYVALNAQTSAVGNTALGSVTATNSQSVFNVTNGYATGGLAVFLNGVKLIDGVDFTATNGTSFTLTSPASSEDIVDYIAYGAVVASSNLQKTGDTMTGNLTIGNGSDLIVEGDLIVAKYKEGFVDGGNSSTSKTIDITSGTLQTVTLTDNCTFTMPSVEAGRSFTLLLKTGTGSFTSTFTGVKWPSDSAPTITTTASKLDILTFVSDGTNWYGNISQNYSV
jgi:hypothetical protein